MNIKPIRTEQDYEAALRAVEPMFDNEPEMNTPEGDFFEVMCLLIEEYEKKHYPIEPPSPIEAIIPYGTARADREGSGTGDW